jgi:Kef-type K+ transport system membrane component KefB
MTELSSNILAPSIEHLNIILLMGLAIFLGTTGARIFQKFRVPQVVGYVVIGLVIGQSGLNIIGRDTVELLSSFNMFALGIIGFMIGGQLRADVFKKYGRQFLIILCSEAIAAFVIVALLTGLAAWYFTADVHTSVAVALVLGAIASATAPAATSNVLWEYKTRGPLTSTILAIVALDDALALLLYGFAASIAAALIGRTNGPLLTTILTAAFEIIGAIVLGVLAGSILSFILKRIKDTDKALAFTISSVLLVIGVSITLRLGAILAAMTLGATIANLARRKRQTTFELVEKFSPPIYALFFVLAGAHLVLSEITGWMIVMVLVYLAGRTAGKALGSSFGARWSHAADMIRKYLGLCLFSQAGVAIGLAIISSRLFEGEFGHAIIAIVMASTFVVEIFGPMLVKLGVKKAGEVGMNVTEEDLIKTYAVADVMDTTPTSIPQDMPLPQILEVFSTTDSLYYPVIDAQSRITGVITIADIKEMFANQDVGAWLLACDVAEPVLDKTTPNTPLEEALDQMRRYDLESIPVVADDSSNRLVGVLDYRKVNRKISAEVLHRRKTADGIATAGP